MIEFCPNCEKEVEVEIIRETEPINVRGEEIEVGVEYYKCAKCNEEFEDLNSGHDSLDEAYRIYRERHCMLQPEDIQRFRKFYGLRQQELSRLLGLGVATLSRYENGALQDEAHENLLRFATEPQNLLEQIKKRPEALNPTKRAHLIQLLQDKVNEEYSFVRFIEQHYGNYEPDEFSGYRRLDLERFFGAVLFFCGSGVFKTKLNKLLFYADFMCFRDNLVSLTGAHYVHLPYGPGPDNFDDYFLAMQKERLLEVREEAWGGELHVALASPEISLFTGAERKILEYVKRKFADFTVEQIKLFSHDEPGYKETTNGERISYKWAERLRL
jgi:putative zinc finger/helix-turn-helix YgiT family protein